MPLQPAPKMHCHRDTSQVRSHLYRWVSSPGSANSTQARGKSSMTSGMGASLGLASSPPAAPGRLALLPMRQAVLDIGSNTGHLLVVDAHRGAAPLPASSFKAPLRLAEHLEDGEVTRSGISALTRFVADAVVVAEDKGAQDMLGFATSAVRDARNCDAVLDHVADDTGVRIAVLPGD